MEPFLNLFIDLFSVVLPLTLFNLYMMRDFSNDCKLVVDLLISSLQLGKLFSVYEGQFPCAPRFAVFSALQSLPCFKHLLL